MADQVGKRCATCRFARDPFTVKVYEVRIDYLTCRRDRRDIPHVCQPCNTCNFWESKEDDDGRR